MLCTLILSPNPKQRRHSSRIRPRSSKHQWGSPGITLYSNSNSNPHNHGKILSRLSQILIMAFTRQSLLLLGNQTRYKPQLDTEGPLNTNLINKLPSISKTK
jgi:hypothetical protein